MQELAGKKRKHDETIAAAPEPAVSAEEAVITEVKKESTEMEVDELSSPKEKKKDKKDKKKKKKKDKEAEQEGNETLPTETEAESQVTNCFINDEDCFFSSKFLNNV